MKRFIGFVSLLALIVSTMSVMSLQPAPAQGKGGSGGGGGGSTQSATFAGSWSGTITTSFGTVAFTMRISQSLSALSGIPCPLAEPREMQRGAPAEAPMRDVAPAENIDVGILDKAWVRRVVGLHGPAPGAATDAVFDAHGIPSTIAIRFPIHAMTGTAIEFPSALYRGPSGQSPAGLLR